MIDVDRGEHIWTVTLNRPEKANSLTESMLLDLVCAMQAAKDARAVVLTGTGRAFCVGADLADAAPADAPAGLAAKYPGDRGIDRPSVRQRAVELARKDCSTTL